MIDVQIKKIEMQGTDLVLSISWSGLPEGADEPNTCVIPVEALADRRRGYGLASDEDALMAIMREHAFRIGELEQEGEERHHQMGGMHSEVEVTHGRGAKTQIAKALQALHVEP